MSGITLSVKLDDTVSQEALARLEAGVRDATPLMDQIGAVLVAGAVERISQTNVTPEGVPWPKSLRAQLSQGLTLHETGALMRSLTEEPGPSEVRVGSNMIYAGVHQTGAIIRAKSGGALHFTLANGEQAMVGAVSIPARPYLGISDGERSDIEDLAQIYFDGLLTGAGV